MSSRLSVATLKSPEFVNITSISPLISKCEIKVLYVGGNRNGSYISKEVAREMAQTLPGTPIVGYYISNKEDFGDHGDQMIIDGEGIKFNTLTTPYGFVAPDSKVWFQEFEDTDEFGNVEVREYLMTEGYLWTGQFEECQRVVDGGNPQSMELDKNSLKGHWSTDTNKGVEFFIINDAIFSKLCILGEDVEPCFEGASVTAPDVSARFSKNDTFGQTLYEMMQELKFTLQNKGEISMENENIIEQETPVIEQNEENFSLEEDKTVETPVVENEAVVDEFKKADEKEEDEKEDPEKDDEKEDSSKDDKAEDKEDKEDEKKKYSLLEEQYNELQNKYSALEADYQKLVEFKQEIENAQKDELIDSFYMLSEEDKKEVSDNKEKYSLEDIKAKLAVICFDKKISFDLHTDEPAVEDKVDAPVVTFNLSNTEIDTTPAWLKVVKPV